MANEAHRGAQRPGLSLLASPRHARRPRLRGRVAAVVVPACLLLGTAQTLGVWSASPPAGATASAAPLGIAVSTFAGDAVTSTPSESVYAGSNVTFEVTLTNSGLSTQTNVSTTVTLASNFVLKSASAIADSGTPFVGTGAITWAVPSLDSGASATLTYTETVDAPLSFESDTTTVSSVSNQSTSAGTKSAAVVVVPAVDLAVTVSDGVDSVAPGSFDAYTITLTNTGPSEAPTVILDDSYSAPFAAVGNTSSLTGTTFSDLGGGQFQWTGIDLAAGASVTLTLSGTVPSTLTGGAAFVDLVTAEPGAGQIDTAPSSTGTDSDTVAGTAGSGPLGLSVSSYNGDEVTSAASESAQAGSHVTYRVRVTNPTSGGQTNVAVPVDLPPSFTLVSSPTASAGTASVSGTVVSWTIPALAAGATATLTYTEATDAPASEEQDATGASATSDQSTTAATAIDAIDVVPAATLAITVSDGVDTVTPGASDTYTVTLTNEGPSAAANATVTESLSAGFTALFAVSSLGGTNFTNLGTDQFAWTMVSLPSGASATFSLIGTVSSSLAAGDAVVDVAGVTVAPGQIDMAASSAAVDSDVVVAAPQAIAFVPPTTGTVGQSVTLSATGGGSGNPVVFSVDQLSGTGVCAVSGTNGTTLQFLSAGTCVIDADQAGTSGFAAAPTVGASVVVEQGPSFSAEAPPTSTPSNQPYAYTFTAGGSPAPAFSLAGGAPSWLSIDPAGGELSGTPPDGTTSFAYSVVATNAVGSATAGPFTVTVAQPADPALADISVALSCPSTVSRGDESSCTLTATNAGPSAARSVSADIVLPGRLVHTGTWGAHRRHHRPGAWRRWHVGTLGAGDAVSFTVTFRAVHVGEGTVFGAAGSNTPDPSPDDNTATAPLHVVH